MILQALVLCVASPHRQSLPMAESFQLLNLIFAPLAPRLSTEGMTQAGRLFKMSTSSDAVETHFIYALIDPRNGRTMYVGKTKTPRKRLNGHTSCPKSNGMRLWISELTALGFVPSMEILELCQGNDWVQRERFHVADCRARFPGLLNVLSGGGGPLDEHYTQEVRQKIGASRQGRKLTPEHIANCAAGNRGQKRTPESRARMSAAMRGKKKSPEHCAKMRLRMLGRKLTPESIAKTSAANRGRKRSAETCAKIGAVHRGKIPSMETRAKMSASQLGRITSPETRAKISAALLGKTRTAETRARMSKAQKGRTLSSEHRAKISASKRAKAIRSTSNTAA